MDARSAGRLAIEQYDSNQDGAIEGEELTNAASLNSVMEELDADGDQRITSEEVTECISNWLTSGDNLVNATCRVEMAGSPLTGATVTFEPESFLGGAITSATAVTNFDGDASLISELARERGFPDGVSLGFYKVRISKDVKGKESIPGRYNSETVLGAAVSPSGRRNQLRFNLSRKK